MRKILIVIFCLVSLIACEHRRGSGNIITETKKTGSFSSIDVSNSFEVEVSTGPTENVVVEADDNLMEFVQVKVVGGELKIRLDDVDVSRAHLKVRITAPLLKSIKASAAAEITVKDELKSDGPINFAASSGSQIKTAVDAPEIKAEVSSGGEVILTGRTKDLHVSSSSGSTISAGDLLSENSFVKASSGGSAHVHASVSVDASASSGGNITYRGAAAKIQKTESSGGKVDKDN